MLTGEFTSLALKPIYTSANQLCSCYSLVLHQSLAQVTLLHLFKVLETIFLRKRRCCSLGTDGMKVSLDVVIGQRWEWATGALDLDRCWAAVKHSMSFQNCEYGRGKQDVPTGCYQGNGAPPLPQVWNLFLYSSSFGLLSTKCYCVIVCIFSCTYEIRWQVVPGKIPFGESSPWVWCAAQSVHCFGFKSSKWGEVTDWFGQRLCSPFKRERPTENEVMSLKCSVFTGFGLTTV